MHDQLKDLGRSIVYQENRKDPRKGSRAWWNREEGPDIVQQKKGTKTVAAFYVNYKESFQDFVLTSEDFTEAPNIRYLRLSGSTLSGDYKDLFSELRWLSWHRCPKATHATNFCPKNLVILDLSYSSIDEHWGGWTQFKVATRSKVLDLSNCSKLSITPDLSTYLSLEILILERCTSLLSIDRSISHLRCLKHLNLNGCSQLQELPVELGSLKALTELLIDNYDLRGSISQVPSSIGALINLERLVICEAIKLTTLPDSIGMLKGLAELDVSYTGIAKLPNAIVNLKSLKVLKMDSSHIKKLPEAIGELAKLEEIYGEYCGWLEMIPSDIGRLPSLKILKLTETRVKDVPDLPRSLLSLCLSSSASENAPEISNLVSLRNLDLCFPSYYDDVFNFPEDRTDGLWCKLELPSITSISSYMGCFCCLKELELSGCKNLRHIRQLPSSLRKLTVNDCNLLEVFDLSNLESLLELTLNEINILDLEGLTSLQRLSVWRCRSSKFNGLERLENLRLLYFEDCGSLQALSSLSNLKNLKDFELWNCPELVEIEGLDKLKSLERLSINDRSLRTLPDLSNLKNLKVFEPWNCSKLVEIKGLDKLESLETLEIGCCSSLRSLPDLSHLKKLKYNWCNYYLTCHWSTGKSFRPLRAQRQPYEETEHHTCTLDA